MKQKTYVLFFLFCCLFMAGGCARQQGNDSDSESSIYKVTKNGTEYTIDTEHQTLSDGVTQYSYTFSGNQSNYDASITYPDGVRFQWQMETGTDGASLSSGGRQNSEEADPLRALESKDLCELLAEQLGKSTQSRGKNFLPAVVFLILGIIAAIFPEAVWYLEFGWRFHNRKPSELAIKVNTGIGISMIVVAVLLFFVL